MSDVDQLQRETSKKIMQMVLTNLPILMKDPHLVAFAKDIAQFTKVAPDEKSFVAFLQNHPYMKYLTE